MSVRGSRCGERAGGVAMSIEVQSKPAAEEKNEILQLLRAGREQVL